MLELVLTAVITVLMALAAAKAVDPADTSPVWSRRFWAEFGVGLWYWSWFVVISFGVVLALAVVVWWVDGVFRLGVL